MNGITRRTVCAGVVAAGPLAAGALAMALAGCRGANGGPGAESADLRRDLDAASAAAAIAPPIRRDAAAQVVSALELGASAASVGTAPAPAPQRRAPAPVRAPQHAPTRVIVRVRYVDAPAADAAVPAGAPEASAGTAAASGGGGTFSPGTVAGPTHGSGAGAGTGNAPGEGAGRASGRQGSCMGHGRGGRGGFPGLPGGSIGLPGGGPYRGTI